MLFVVEIMFLFELFILGYFYKKPLVVEAFDGRDDYGNIPSSWPLNT